MQGDPVALTIKDDGPEPVRSDLVPGLEHLTDVGLNGRNRFVEAALCIQVDQQPVIGRSLAILPETETGRICRKVTYV